MGHIYPDFAQLVLEQAAWDREDAVMMDTDHARAPNKLLHTQLCPAARDACVLVAVGPFAASNGHASPRPRVLGLGDACRRCGLHAAVSCMTLTSVWIACRSPPLCKTQ